MVANLSECCKAILIERPMGPATKPGRRLVCSKCGQAQEVYYFGIDRPQNDIRIIDKPEPDIIRDEDED